MPLLGYEKIVLIGNPTQSTATVKEISEFSQAEGGVTEEQLNTKLALKADKTQLNKTGVGLANVDNTSDVNKPVSTAQKAALDLKADKTQLNKAGVGLTNVDNTSDVNKPVSTAQKAAIDKKVDLVGLQKTYNSATPVQHTGEAVDLHELDFGEHLIRTDTALNAPPDTKITLVQVIKTHDEVGGGGAGSVLQASAFEQGTISESSDVGTDYDLAKYPNTEPLHSSRVRTINPVAITEYSTISVAAGYEYSVLAFDSDQKYLGRSTFMAWGSSPRLTYPNATYIAIAVKKVGTNIAITPADITAAKVTVTTLGQTAGGSKLLIAWGAMVGDLHTKVNIAGAWSDWRRISSPLPIEANDGDHLIFRGGKWVAEAPSQPLR